jgi:hypothetical protein
MSQLISRSPTAEVNISGNNVKCILDTGADVSLIADSYYKSVLAPLREGPCPLGDHFSVYGVGGLKVPIQGYVVLPLTLNALTIDAHFLVVDDDLSGFRIGVPVILGCNVLRALKTAPVSQYSDDAESWDLIRRWCQLSRSSVNRIEVNRDTKTMKTAAGRTHNRLERLPPRAVQTIQCTLRGPLSQFQDKHVIVETIQSHSIDSSSPGLGDLPTGCVILDSYTKINKNVIDVVVTNLNAHAVYIPPYTHLVNVCTCPSPDPIAIRHGSDWIEVHLSRVAVVTMATSAAEQAPRTPEPGKDTAYRITPTDCSPPREEFVFEDGTVYHLPWGISTQKMTLQPEELEQFVRVIQKHDDTFAQDEFDLGTCAKIPHRVELIDTIPVQFPYRRVPPPQLLEVKDMVQRLKEKGLIRHSDSPYANDAIIVKKEDGSLRILVDFRKLNGKAQKTVLKPAPLEGSIEALQGARYFSSMDLAHGIGQVTLDPSSRQYTAFRLPFGLFEFEKLPAGLTGSPATFQRVMEMCLGDLNIFELLLYLDDVLLFSDTVETHLDRLDRVLTRLKSFDLKVKGKKCRFFQEKVQFLGHIVSQEGISVCPDKIEKVKNWPTPSSGTEVRSYLGLCSYYRKYIPGFAQIAAPLHQLVPPSTTKGQTSPRPFRWTTEAQAAFDSLKTKLTNTPVLKYPDFQKPFI